MVFEIFVLAFKTLRFGKIVSVEARDELSARSHQGGIERRDEPEAILTDGNDPRVASEALVDNARGLVVGAVIYNDELEFAERLILNGFYCVAEPERCVANRHDNGNQGGYQSAARDRPNEVFRFQIMSEMPSRLNSTAFFEVSVCLCSRDSSGVLGELSRRPV